jgi:hypothetical protein
MNRVTPFVLLKRVETACEGQDKRTRRLSDMNVLVHASTVSDERKGMSPRRSYGKT